MGLSSYRIFQSLLFEQFAKFVVKAFLGWPLFHIGKAILGYRLILEDEQAAFARDDDIEVAVGLEINDWNLHAAADAAAV